MLIEQCMHIKDPLLHRAARSECGWPRGCSCRTATVIECRRTGPVIPLEPAAALTGPETETTVLVFGEGIPAQQQVCVPTYAWPICAGHQTERSIRQSQDSMMITTST